MTAFDTLARYEAKWALPPFVTSDPMYANNLGKLDDANRWVETASPLIDAYLSIYALHDAAYGCDTYEAREAREIYRAAQEQLFDAIESTRDGFIGNETVGLQDDPGAQECADEFNDWLSATVVTVQAALNTARMNRSSTLENRNG